jgi:hypothetical protein
MPTPLTFPDCDVSADGQGFLMPKPSEQAAPTQNQRRAELVRRIEASRACRNEVSPA